MGEWECWDYIRHLLDPSLPCSGVDVPTFASKMYQWASTLTYQGRNMPFSLPFRTDPLETGFVVGRPQPCSLIMSVANLEPLHALLCLEGLARLRLHCRALAAVAAQDQQYRQAGQCRRHHSNRRGRAKCGETQQQPSIMGPPPLRCCKSIAS